MSNFFIDFLWQSCVSRPSTWDVSNESTQVKVIVKMLMTNAKKKPTFRWNIIATKACCLSGRHLSIVGDDEAAFIEVFIEVRRAKTISRPDLFCTAGIPADERWQSSLQVTHDLNSLSIGQPTNHHTIPLSVSNQMFQLDRWICPKDPIFQMVALVHLVPTSC